MEIRGKKDPTKHTGPFSESSLTCNLHRELRRVLRGSPSSRPMKPPLSPTKSGSSYPFQTSAAPAAAAAEITKNPSSVETNRSCPASLLCTEPVESFYTQLEIPRPCVCETGGIRSTIDLPAVFQSPHIWKVPLHPSPCICSFHLTAHILTPGLRPQRGLPSLPG